MLTSNVAKKCFQLWQVWENQSQSQSDVRNGAFVDQLSTNLCFIMGIWKKLGSEWWRWCWSCWILPFFIGPESDHWLCLSVTNWLTHWLPNSRLVNLMPAEDTTAWWCQNSYLTFFYDGKTVLLKLLLLLLLMMRIVLVTICCRFGSWGLVIKLNFCSAFEDKIWSRF